MLPLVQAPGNLPLHRPARLVLAALAASLVCPRPTASQTGSPSASADLSRPFVVTSWTVRDGLPVNGITDVVQSPAGYLWLATWDGLVRFDGARFTVFNTANTEALPSNRIVGLDPGPDGTIWLRTERGQLVRYRDGEFTYFGKGRGVRDNAHRVHIGARGTWIGTDEDVRVLEGERFVPVAGDAIRDAVHALLEDSHGRLWVGTERALYRVDGAGVERFDDVREATSSVRALFEDGAGRIWIGTGAGLLRFDGDRFERIARGDGRRFDESVGHITAPAGSDSVWIATTEGLLVAGRNGLQVLHPWSPWTEPRFDPAGAIWYSTDNRLFRDSVLVFQTSQPPLPWANITGIWVDHEGSTWVAADNGLHRLMPSLFRSYGFPEGLPQRRTAVVLEDRAGHIWIAGADGLSRLAGDTTVHYGSPGDPPWVQSLMEDRDGFLWVGTERLRRCRIPELECGAPPGDRLSAHTTHALHQDAVGDIWAGTPDGLYRLRGGVWSRMDDDVGVAPGSAVVRSFLEARDGTLWMATLALGVAAYRADRLRRITSADGLPSDLIRSLYEDAAGHIWIGTEGRGLARLTVEADDVAPKIASVRQRDGLYDETIHRILDDDFGNLWMSTNRGIFRVALAQLNNFADGRASRIHAIAYTERDGMRHREANGGTHPAGIRSRDGRLWFPTQDGVVVVNPANAQRRRDPPPLVIERVVARGRELRADAHAVALAARDRDFEVDYTALSFRDAENTQFRYRLEGYTDEWTDAGKRRTAFFTNVPPGRYTFRVIASVDGTVWHEAGGTLELRVAPYFRETRTAQALAGLALLLLAFTGFRWRVGRLHARQRELTRLVETRTAALHGREQQLAAQNEQLATQAVQLQELDRAKSNFFANVSHEFRTPLTLTIGPLEDAQSMLPAEHQVLRRPIDMALRNARRLLRLVNQILDVAKLDAAEMKLTPRPLDLAAFTRGVASAFDRLAESRGILLTVDTPAALRGAFDADALEKILTNLLSNAVKFTPERGHVTVELRTADDAVLLSVRDTGPGIEPAHVPHVFDRFYQVDETNLRAQPGTGIGLSLVKDLVTLHGGTIEVVSGGRSTGTTFSVRIPLQAEADAEGVVEVDDVVHVADPVEPESLMAVAEADDPDDDLPALLLVDDSADLRAYVRAHFVPRFRVIEASDGPAALLLARRTVPDIIVSDVMMPGMDGNELSRQLRSSPETDFIPIVLLTAQATAEHRIAGLVQGADDYIAKPFDMRELEARVDNLIQSRKRLRERYPPSATVAVPPRPAELQPRDRAFVDRVCEAVEAHLSDSSFGVTELAHAVFHDRSHLYRRVSELLGETPSELLRRARLEYACRLLDENAGTVAHVAYAAGFNSVSSFSRAFREANGMSPTEFRARTRTA